ncbi:MAG TPA: aminotransferase class V-fold PLP-dependent enzyme [Acidimicrobiales bacterium]|nr:aminotransferase class V-fold PLP-dependent enzyme [Acidimicrobiales bacterium]
MRHVGLIGLSRHYLDHASTSPARPEVIEAVTRWLGAADAGDPARVHTEGRTSRAVIEDARDSVAALVGARSREVVFTGSATEAINTAVWGAVRAAPAGAAILCAGVEHSAARDSSLRLAPLVPIPVDRHGRIHPDAVREAGAVARHEHGAVALVHCQWGNHEVGTVHPVAEVVGAAHELDALVHVDAAAAAGHVAVDFSGCGADLLTVSAHKLGGPAGAGALIVRRGLRLEPLLVGGDQERARRAGMENVAVLAGFGAAAAGLDADARDAEADRARRFTARALTLALAVERVEPYGDPAGRLPHIVCVGVPGVEAEAVVLGLDRAGIAVHSGSACSSESLEPSPVLAAMGVDAERSIRISVGWSTTEEDVDAFGAAFPDVVGRLRALGGPAG